MVLVDGIRQNRDMDQHTQISCDDAVGSKLSDSSENPLKSSQKSPNSAEDLLFNFKSFLSSPVRSESQASDSFHARCPWCGQENRQNKIVSVIFGKNLFKCSGCEQLTSRCQRFADCKRAAKGSLLWDQRLCSNCDQAADHITNTVLDIQDFFSGVSCGVLFGGPEELPKTLQPHTSNKCVRRVSLKYHLDQSKHLESPTVLRRHSNFGLEISIETTVFETEADPESPIDSCRSQGHEPYMEPWMVVRDTVLCWPGPERTDVARCLDLCAHGAFARRWLAACGGDPARAVRQILVHLRWRREFGVDSMEDEVRPPPPTPHPPLPFFAQT